VGGRQIPVEKSTEIGELSDPRTVREGWRQPLYVHISIIEVGVAQDSGMGCEQGLKIRVLGAGGRTV